MQHNGTQTKMSKIPNCDICAGNGASVTAYADASLANAGMSSWAYVCREHFKRMGCSLGLGRGQELVQA